jgi:hypothetical protein
VIDGEEAHGGAVLGRHVRNRRAVCEGELVEPVAEELDDLFDHASLAQRLRHGEHQVGGRGTLRQLALELEADHLRQQHGHRLAEHGGLCLDAAHPPTQHAQPVDHGGVRVGADQRIGVGQGPALDVAGEDHRRQVLEIHLVHDAGARRNGAKVFECGLAPAQELVALLIALELEPHVLGEAAQRAVVVDLHAVIDDQIDWLQRVDALWVAAQLGEGLAHGGQVHHARNAREVLQQHTRRAIGNLQGRFGLGIPVGDRHDVSAPHGLVVLVAQEILQQHADRVRQGRDVADLGLDQRVQTEDVNRATPQRQGRTACEAVDRGGHECRSTTAILGPKRGKPRPRHLFFHTDCDTIYRCVADAHVDCTIAVRARFLHCLGPSFWRRAGGATSRERDRLSFARARTRALHFARARTRALRPDRSC